MQNYQCRGKSYQPSRNERDILSEKNKHSNANGMKTEKIKKLFTALFCCHANESRIGAAIVRLVSIFHGALTPVN